MIFPSTSPLRPVAPEHACRASRIRIEGAASPCFLHRSKMWWTTELPA